ncbi:MAG: sigma-70 family RNA polymerase sigma factor [Planctomycetota bacterium]
MIEGLRTADNIAWARFYELYYDKLIEWACREGLNECDAEEFVDDLIFALTKYLGGFRYDRSKGSFRGYLRRSLKNLIKEGFRKKARHGKCLPIEDELDEPAAPGESSILELICEEYSKACAIVAHREVLDEASERERYIWIAMYEKTATIKEIVKEFGVSGPQLYRIKNQVSKRMRARFEELSGDE